MKNCLAIIALFFICHTAKASDKDSTVYYNLPDSVKAVQFMAEVKVTSVAAKYFSAALQSNVGSLRLEEYKGHRSVSFLTHRLARIVTGGNGVNTFKEIKYAHFKFDYNWQLDKTYKLLIAVASDSAANICLCSAYIFLPDENKWKFIGTAQHPFGNTTINYTSINISSHKKGSRKISIGDVWCQRQNGSWKNMKNEILPNPTIVLFGHVDSVQQRQIDIKLIETAIASGKTDAKNNIESVYYTMMKEGTGRKVTVDDTVTVYYKGYLFANDSVFDQTRDKPATFPLKRLIRGWQLAVPLCKVGGKIKIVIPSDLAYSIRTRSAKIPPNSILVFEIEVLDAKSP